MYAITTCPSPCRCALLPSSIEGENADAFTKLDWSAIAGLAVATTPAR